jgi:hypothetical protein
MVEWFHAVIQYTNGESLVKPNETDKSRIKGIVKDYNDGKVFLFDQTDVQPKNVFSFLIFRTFNRIHNPSADKILKTQNVTSDFRVKPPGQPSPPERKPINSLDLFPKRKFKIDKKLCFVLMPFDKRYDSIYRDVILPVTDELGFGAIRSDDIFDVKPIMRDIWENINTAKFLIAVLSGKNPNVFYELGLSHSIGKLVILLSDRIRDVPFDLRHLRIVTYDTKKVNAEKLKKSLTKTIVAEVLKRKSPI